VLKRWLELKASNGLVAVSFWELWRETATLRGGQTDMPRQEEHDRPENLVDQPGQAAHSARTLGEAADSNQSLDGYFAVNNARESDEEGGSEAGDERSTDKSKAANK
jgi:hypothetical protein